MPWLKKLTPILIPTLLITIICKKSNFLRVSHASLFKRLTETMKCTAKLVTKVISKNYIKKKKVISPKNETC